MISILDIVESTTVDGPGFRTSIYCAGCHHRCPGCHNPKSWPISAGHKMSTEDIMTVIERNRFENVTFSGGDPFYQTKGFIELAKDIRQRTTKTIWCYTGFKFEQLLNIDKFKDLLMLIDVLVDGPYIEALRDTDLLFRGSSNQRIIDVQKSLAEGKIVEFDFQR